MGADACTDTYASAIIEVSITVCTGDRKETPTPSGIRVREFIHFNSTNIHIQSMNSSKSLHASITSPGTKTIRMSKTGLALAFMELIVLLNGRKRH